VQFAVRYGFLAVQVLGIGGILLALISLILGGGRTVLLQPAAPQVR
jgi:hypothetical protein